MIVDGRGSSYPWSRFMDGWPILISMAYLTFSSNQLYYMYYLANTLTLSLVKMWCSCAQCSPTAVSGFLRLMCSFVIKASALSVSPMYVRGIQGTTPGIPLMDVGCVVLSMHQDGSKCAFNTRVSASELPCMFGKPTLVVCLVLVDVVLGCCLGIRTMNIHCL